MPSEQSNIDRMPDLIRVGDLMQSEGSRLAAWARSEPNLPYEVYMALLSIERAVLDWTEIRKGWRL